MKMKYEITLGCGKKVDARVRGFTIRTDQPVADGGEDAAPGPFELFLASIGTARVFTLFHSARRGAFQWIISG
jgi:putative redox protein